MESSRLFVKNLPPSINEADFRKHFSAGGREVTDIKLIAKRRIGYVGYKTPGDAAKAVKFFHKSYIRMSKISVELARPISDPSLPAVHKVKHVANKLPTPEPEPKPKEEEADGESGASRKRKRGVLDESDPKLKEYLDVMRPGQKTSSSLEGIRGNPAEEKDVEMAVVPLEDESDNEYEEIPAQKKKRLHQDVDSTIPSAPAAEIPVPDLEPAPEDVPKTSQPADATDDDWLRSRTNRLLDLVDPDDPTAMTTAVTRPSQQGAAPTGPSPSGDINMDSDSAEVEEPREPSAEAAEDDAMGQIRRTARLFVRNLPFKATETELREHFAKYGEVEEVSVHFIFLI